MWTQVLAPSCCWAVALRCHAEVVQLHSRGWQCICSKAGVEISPIVPISICSRAAYLQQKSPSLLLKENTTKTDSSTTNKKHEVLNIDRNLSFGEDFKRSFVSWCFAPRSIQIWVWAPYFVIFPISGALIFPSQTNKKGWATTVNTYKREKALWMDQQVSNSKQWHQIKQK